MSETVALGFRAHSGWTAAVAVAGSPVKPIIVERRRIETADARLPGSKQPYHAAEGLDSESAEALIRQCRESSTLLATRALSAWAAQLREDGLTVVGAGILFASGRPLPDLAATLRSHALIHTAEGEFFRKVLMSACEHCSLPVTKVREREVWEKAATVFELSGAALKTTHRRSREVDRAPLARGRKVGVARGMDRADRSHLRFSPGTAQMLELVWRFHENTAPVAGSVSLIASKDREKVSTASVPGKFNAVTKTLVNVKVTTGLVIAVTVAVE